MPRTNALAYFVAVSVTKKNGFNNVLSPEQAKNQRGPQRRNAQGVSGRDPEAEGTPG
jgi:hypothetical protein